MGSCKYWCVWSLLTWIIELSVEWACFSVCGVWSVHWWLTEFAVQDGSICLTPNSWIVTFAPPDSLTVITCKPELLIWLFVVFFHFPGTSGCPMSLCLGEVGPDPPRAVLSQTVTERPFLHYPKRIAHVPVWNNLGTIGSSWMYLEGSVSPEQGLVVLLVRVELREIECWACVQVSCIL